MKNFKKSFICQLICLFHFQVSVLKLKFQFQKLCEYLNFLLALFRTFYIYFLLNNHSSLKIFDIYPLFFLFSIIIFQIYVVHSYFHRLSLYITLIFYCLVSSRQVEKKLIFLKHLFCIFNTFFSCTGNISPSARACLYS